MVSIIIPTYNREKTISRAVESILNQTIQDFEIIIVDDNSKDNTEEVVKSLQDKRISYVRQETNMGACAARNIGIRLAKGNFIAFQDSDDEWLPDKLEKHLKFLETEQSDIVFCSFNSFTDSGNRIVPRGKIDSHEIHSRLFKGNFISTQTILGKKECFVEELFDERLPRLQDWELVLRLSKKFKIVHLDELLVNVYLGNDSISKSPEKALRALEIIMGKNKDTLTGNKKHLANFYNIIGEFSILTEDFDKKYFYLAFKNNKFNLKNIIRATLCKLNLINTLFK